MIITEEQFNRLATKDDLKRLEKTLDTLSDNVSKVLDELIKRVSDIDSSSSTSTPGSPPSRG